VHKHFNRNVALGLVRSKNELDEFRDGLVVQVLWGDDLA
jgi:hypothetical protein